MYFKKPTIASSLLKGIKLPCFKEINKKLALAFFCGATDHLCRKFIYNFNIQLLLILYYIKDCVLFYFSLVFLQLFYNNLYTYLLREYGLNLYLRQKPYEKSNTAVE